MTTQPKRPTLRDAAQELITLWHEPRLMLDTAEDMNRMSAAVSVLYTAPTPKLTPAQRRVIDNLKCGRHWNYGLEMPGNTKRSLLRHGLIEPDVFGGVVISWRLTEKGKSV